MPLDKKEKNRLHYLKNKEKVKEKNRLYHLNNKEEIKKKSKLYQQTDKRKKVHRIKNWKHNGILCFDFDLLYDLFISTDKCEFCKIELTTGRYMTSTTRCLDHDHSITDKFNIRGVLCHSCNRKDVLKGST